jgi:hypothetical protein
MKCRILCAVITIVCSSLLVLGQTPAPPFPPPAKLQYSIIDVPGELATFAFAINKHGDIGGAVLDFAGNAHGYVTDRDGGNLRLVDFPGATLTNVSGMNDRGDVAGQYVDEAGTSHTYSLIDGVFSTVDFPGSIFDTGVGINDRREIIGIFQGADFSIHGYRLADGVFTAIDDPDAPVLDTSLSSAFTITEVSSVNNRGDVVGFFLDANDFGHSFLLSAGVFQTIAVPAGVEGTTVAGLNEAGDVVGTFTDSTGTPQGFRLNHRGFTFVNFPGAVSTNPNAITSSGRIVGIYADTTGFTHSFLAEKAGNNDDAANSGNDAVATTLPTAAATNRAAPIIPLPGLNPCVTGKFMRPDPVTKLLSCKP